MGKVSSVFGRPDNASRRYFSKSINFSNIINNIYIRFCRICRNINYTCNRSVRAHFSRNKKSYQNNDINRAVNLYHLVSKRRKG
ncbi:hypothetical protein Hanom_Chr16g01444351 [Helianthus anomalus]